MAAVIATPPPVARLTIERAEGLRIAGWAVGADGGAADLGLTADGVELRAVVRRMERPDVSAALDLPQLTYGFEIDLPSAVWRHVDKEGRLALQLAADDQVKPLALTMRVDKLDAWIGALQKTSGAVPDDPAGSAAAHLNALYESAWGARLALDEKHSSPLGQCQAPQPTVRGRVEAVEGLTIRGWALGSGDDEGFSLVCQGESIDFEIVRLEREDVRRATGARRIALGFAIEPAGWLWRLVPGADEAELRVVVDGAELESPLAVLSKDAIRDAVRKMQSEVFDPKSASEQQRSDRQFHELALLEHVACASVLGTLGRDEARFIVDIAERFGLTSILGDDPKGDAPARAAFEPAAVPTLWRLLRLTNEALAVPETSLIDAAEHALLVTGVQGVQRDRFLSTLVPFFCDEGTLDEYLSWLAPAAIAELAAAEGRWELSIAVAVRAAQSDFAAVAELLARLQQTAARDWLNTGCLLDAARRMLKAAADAKLDSALLETFVGSLLGLIDGMVGDPASRLHDRHLMTLTSAVVAQSARFDAMLAHRVEALALRAYGLVPDFWRLIATPKGHASSGSLKIDSAKSSFDVVIDGVRRCGDLSTTEFARIALHLQRFRDWRNPDADVLLRQMLVSAAFRGSERCREDEATLQAMIRLLPEADAVRFAAMPLAIDHPLRAPRPDLMDVLRRAGDVPLNANHALEAEALSAQRALWAALSAGANATMVAERFHALRAIALPLIGPRDDYVGVDLMTTGALLAREALPHDDDVLENLRPILLQAIGSSASRRDEPLPAALTVALSRLKRRRRTSPADLVLAGLVDDLHRAVGKRVPDLDTIPSDPLVLAQPDPLHSTLVAIFTCRAHLSTRVASIRAGWWQRLRAEGVVCLAVTGGATDEPLLEDDVLSLPVADDRESLPSKTLALIEWVVKRTDFEHLFKIDDDCHLQTARFLSSAWQIRHHYVGSPSRRYSENIDRLRHRSRSSSARARYAIDKSPDSSFHADAATGYTLSRFAMNRVLEARDSARGIHCSRNSFFEDMLLADLLGLQAIRVRGEEHHVYGRRCLGEQPVAVGAFANTFYPSVHSPTLITHLDEEDAQPHAAQLAAGLALQPSKIWTVFSEPRIGGAPGINQLELLSALERLSRLTSARIVVVLVVRNEKTLLPHFLDHYRQIGVRHFIAIDNLSDDGSRELLLGQPDVVTYSADTEYRWSRYGVAWQEAVMSHHCLGKWVLLADADEFLVDRGGAATSIQDVVASLESESADAARVGMIDMYPKTPLEEANLELGRPFDTCGYRDTTPLIEWRLGSGAFSNSTTWLSALRHRLLPDSAPNFYTSQKIALLRYMPWIRLSEGLHYAAGVNLSERALAFAHFKYHAGFRAKVLEEVRRKQHFGAAQEYGKYLGMLREANASLYDSEISRELSDRESILPAQRVASKH